MTASAVFQISLGALMIGQWTLLLVRGEVAEAQTAPREITFHLAAEFLTAIALIASGVGLLAAWPAAEPTTFLGMGMLLYAVINGTGYFAQRERWGMVALFAALGILTVCNTVWLGTAPR